MCSELSEMARTLIKTFEFIFAPRNNVDVDDGIDNDDDDVDDNVNIDEEGNTEEQKKINETSGSTGSIWRLAKYIHCEESVRAGIYPV